MCVLIRKKKILFITFMSMILTMWPPWPSGSSTRSLVFRVLGSSSVDEDFAWA